jgi:hypothetical protein
MDVFAFEKGQASKLYGKLPTKVSVISYGIFSMQATYDLASDGA